MKTLLTLFLLTFAAPWSLCVAASDTQDTPMRVGPGSGSIDTTRLVAYQTATKWGVQRLTPGIIDGRETWNIVNSVYGADNPLIDHIILDRHTLELIGRHTPYFAIGNHYLSATIIEQELSGSLNQLNGGDPLVINTHLAEKVFEESTLGVILASLSLQVGYRVNLPSLSISASSHSFSPGTVEIHVTGQEEVEAGDGKTYQTWVVEAQWSGVDYREVHWIANTPPYSIAKKATFPNGRVSESGFISVSIDK